MTPCFPEFRARPSLEALRFPHRRPSVIAQVLLEFTMHRDNGC